MEQKEYRLAAIMFTDIHGFSSMMEKDEAKTLAMLGFHNELIGRLVAEHSGTVIKTIGDAVLADFRTTVDAVKCSVKVQEEFRAYNADKPADPVRLRIGVHLGDIHFFENNAIGEGINIASRLQSLAKPGRICISKEVYDQVSGKLNLNYISVGKAKLKNVSREIDAFEIVPEGEQLLATDAESAQYKKPGEDEASQRMQGESPKSPSASSDMDEIKDFVMNQVKKVSRRISVKKIKEIFPGESPEIDRLLDKLADRGYLTKLEKADGEVDYGANESHTWDEDLDPGLPSHIKEKIERKVARKMDKYAYKYNYKYGGSGSAADWIEKHGRSLRNMSWEQYVQKAKEKAERARAGFPGHLIPYVFVNAGLFLINLITSSVFPWFLFPLGGWGIGIVCHLVSIRNNQRRNEEVAKLPDLSKEGMLTYNRYYKAKSALNSHIGAYVAVNGFIFLINLITSIQYHPWFLYPAIAWGVGLLIHMSVALPKIASLKRKLKEIIGKAGGVFTGKKQKSHAEEETLVAEALSIRDAIIAEIDSYGKKSSPIDADMKPLLIKYVDQVRDLNSRYAEVDRLISSIPMNDLDSDMMKLREKSEQSKSPYMKQEYEKSIEEIKRHRHSFEELNNQKEIIGLRLKSSMNNLRQLQIDLARMKSLSVSGDSASVSLLKDKTKELSQYLDDLREGYRELEE
jgi:class 3 adenylate cyclase